MKNIFVTAAILCAHVIGFAQSANKTSGFVRAGNDNIYYEITGAGKPLILLHAGLQDSRMWDEQVKAFSPFYKVVTIDLSGHGRTTGIDTVLLIADALKTLMDSLKMQKVSIIGLSLGSVCATDFALAYPQKVEKLILVSPGLVGWAKHVALDSVSKHYFDDNENAYKTNDTGIIARQFTKTWCVGPYRAPAEVNQRVRNYVLQTTAACVFKHHMVGWPNFDTVPAAERVTNIHSPTLIINGDKDVKLIVGISSFLHESIKGSRRITFPGVAHMLNMELPDDFNQAVLKFLKE